MSPRPSGSEVVPGGLQSVLLHDRVPARREGGDGGGSGGQPRRAPQQVSAQGAGSGPGGSGLPHGPAAEPEGGRRRVQVGLLQPRCSEHAQWGPASPVCRFRAGLQLRSMPALVSTLQVLAETRDVGPLLRYLLPHLVQNLFLCSSGETWDTGVDNCNQNQIRVHLTLSHR